MIDRNCRTTSANNTAMPGQPRSVCVPLPAEMWARLDEISKKENKAKGALVRGPILKFIEDYQRGVA